MAVIKNNTVEIFSMPGKKLVRTIELGQQRVSYFKWLEDRDLALMGLYYDNAAGTSRVVLTHVNPVREGNEHSSTINNLPHGSKMTDVAYSTATNVIYMQIQTSTEPDLYRIYRTDADQDLTRIYLTTNRIGRIGVLYDQDVLLYDNVMEGTVIARFGDGSWRVISPKLGNYSLVGLDVKNNIYIAKLNAEGLAATIFKGQLGNGFAQDRTLQTPMEVRHLKMRDIAENR
jgi:hypothetical protein